MNKIIFDKDDSFIKKNSKLYNEYKNVMEINDQTKLLFNLYDFLSLYIHDLFKDIINCNIDQWFLYEHDFRLKTINRDILPLFHPMFEYIDFLTSVNLHGYFKINTISQWEIEREFKRYKERNK